MSVAFQTDKPLSEYGPLAAQVEAYGFDAVSVYNDLYFQPAWPALLEMAKSTNRVRLGPAAVNPFTSHPIQLAGQAALLDEASGGRAYLGLSRGAWLESLGLGRDDAPRALEEALICIRRLLSGSTEPFDGNHFQLRGGDRLRWEIPRPDLPFLLGSWGPRTIDRCRRLVQEVKLGGTSNPQVVAEYRQLLDRGGEGSVGLVVGAVTVVDRDRDGARQLARKEAALYLPVIAGLDPHLDLDPDRRRALKQASAGERPLEEIAGWIEDPLLDQVTIAGTPEEVIRRALELVEAGADRIEFGTPHGVTPAVGLELLGREVLPALVEFRNR